MINIRVSTDKKYYILYDSDHSDTLVFPKNERKELKEAVNTWIKRKTKQPSKLGLRRKSYE